MAIKHRIKIKVKYQQTLRLPKKKPIKTIKVVELTERF